VHGIFSTGGTFDKMRATFEQSAELNAWDLDYFDYDFMQTIPLSSHQLHKHLTGRPARSVTLVCHSMGGLVARFAILLGDLPCVRRIVMLGTPNFGSITAAQLGLLAQLARGVTGRIWANFSRKQGLRDLTRVQSLVDEFLNDPHVRPQRAEAVEYVTIPGTFYHRDRQPWEGVTGSRTFGFSVGNIAASFLTGQFGLWSVELDIPHDGIVEESSVSLIASEGSRFSEKTPAIEHPDRFRPPRYAHIETRSARQLTHTDIQNDPVVIALVRDLIAAGSLWRWHRKLAKNALYNYSSIQVP
jgi:hypothetical protein